MSCTCKQKANGEVDIPHTIRPDEPCVFCAEKHFAAAWALVRECGYENANRSAVSGEIVLSQWHIYKKDHKLAEDLRDLRHAIQNRNESEVAGRWTELAERFNQIVEKELKKGEKE